MRRLTPEEVCQVPQLLEDKHSIKDIAKLFGVTVGAIRKLVQEERWERYAVRVGEPYGKVDKCPDCGGLVVDDTQPCMVCKVRRRKELRRLFKFL